MEESEDEEGNSLIQPISLGKNGVGHLFTKESDPFNTIVPTIPQKPKGDTESAPSKKKAQKNHEEEGKEQFHTFFFFPFFFFLIFNFCLKKSF